MSKQYTSLKQVVLDSDVHLSLRVVILPIIGTPDGPERMRLIEGSIDELAKVHVKTPFALIVDILELLTQQYDIARACAELGDEACPTPTKEMGAAMSPLLTWQEAAAIKRHWLQAKITPPPEMAEAVNKVLREAIPTGSMPQKPEFWPHILS